MTALVLLSFLGSRVLYYALGVRFDARPLDTFFQFADSLLLRTQLTETLWALHTQPPGFNLIAGLVLKLAGRHYAAAFHFFFLVCGLAAALSILALLRRFEVPRALAATLTIVFMASPGVVLFENFLIYDYLIYALLTFSAVALFRCLDRPSAGRLSLFFGLLTALAYTRSLFHWIWYAAILAFMLWVLRREWRRVALIGGLGAALIAGLFLKNQVLVGKFASSTWLGFSLYSIGVHQLSGAERERFIAAGVLSPLARHTIGGRLQEYSGFFRMPPATGIAALDEPVRASGSPNFNHAAYVQVQGAYARDFRSLVKAYPRVLLRSQAIAWFTYFLPHGDFPFFDQNRPRIRRLDRAANLVLFGQFHDASDRKALRRKAAAGSRAGLALHTGMFLLVGLPALWLYGAVRLWRERRQAVASTVVLAYMLFNIVFLTAIINALSPFENNRYRLNIDGFHVVLAGTAVTALIRRGRSAAVPRRSPKG